MKKTRSLLIALSIVMVLLILAVLAPYMIHFRNSCLSNKPSDWGTFGDYMGGILNPIFALINILVLLYLTFRIAQLESDRSQKELKQQKAYALYALQHDALKQFNTVLNKVMTVLSVINDESSVKLALIHLELGSLTRISEYLFPSLKPSGAALNKTLSDLHKILEAYDEKTMSVNDFFTNSILPKYSAFNEAKSAFILALQQDIRKADE